jgi:hypothetical protein
MTQSQREHLDTCVAPIFRATDAYIDLIATIKNKFPNELSLEIACGGEDEPNVS